MKEELFTINVDWANHKTECFYKFMKVITCFACGEKGQITNKEVE